MIRVKTRRGKWHDGSGRGGRILVVDDDEGIRGALTDLLTENGCDVRLAANGKEALELCHSHPAPDLIFLDLMMPVMGAADFIRVKDADPQLAALALSFRSPQLDRPYPAFAGGQLEQRRA